MKSIKNWILSVVMGFGAVACSPDEYDSPNVNGLPSVSDANVSISVNEENIVKFSVTDAKVVPVWIFGEGDQVVQNNYERRFKKEGTYSVQFKLMNANGISDGVRTVEFTVNTTWVDPFDPTPYIAKLAGDGSRTWVFDRNNTGHLGCGESVANPTGWWNCAPNDKAGFGLYDDELTFAATKDYTYNPGDDGLIYVNAGCTFESGHGEDYDYAVETQNATYTIEKDGEDLYLVFPASTFVGYVSSDESFANPRFKITKITDYILELVNFAKTTGNPDGIAWQYRFCQKGYEGGVPEVFDEGIAISQDEWANKIKGTWTWEPSSAGHIGCGESGSTGLGWWSAAANEKADWGLYDDMLTFGDTGVYTYSAGDDGKLYCNVGCGYKQPAEEDWPLDADNKKADYMVDQDDVTGTYAVTQEGEKYYLTLAAECMLSYIPHADALSTPKYQILEMTTTKMELVIDNGAIAWHYKFKKVE